RVRRVVHSHAERRGRPRARGPSIRGMAEPTLEERVTVLERRLTRVHSDVNAMTAEVALAQMQKMDAQHDAAGERSVVEVCSRELAAICNQLPDTQAGHQERIRDVIERLDRVVREG